MNITHSLTIDVLRPRANVIHVVQDDSTRLLEISLLKGDRPFDISDGENETIVGSVAYERADKSGGTYDTLPGGGDAVTVSGTIITATLVGEVFAKAGTTRINIVFSTESGRMLHTFAVLADVEKAAKPLDEPNPDYYNVRSLADAAAAINDLQREVNELGYVDVTDLFVSSGMNAQQFIATTVTNVSGFQQFKFHDSTAWYLVTVQQSVDEGCCFAIVWMIDDDGFCNIEVWRDGQKCGYLYADGIGHKIALRGVANPVNDSDAANMAYAKPYYVYINGTSCDKTNTEIYNAFQAGRDVKAIIDTNYIGTMRQCNSTFASFKTEFIDSGLEWLWAEVDHDVVSRRSS